MGSLGGRDLNVTGINAKGKVVGYAEIPATDGIFSVHAFLAG